MTTQSLQVAMPTVKLINGIPKTTSLDIADHFKKRHDNVLRAIEKLKCPDDSNALKSEVVDSNRRRIALVEDFNRLNFEPVEYLDSKGESRPMYLITRDGFTLLAMGFTGKQAMEWKIKYIQAFNLMEAELHKSPVTKPARPTLTWTHTQALTREMEQRFIREHGQPLLFPPIWKFTRRVTAFLLAHFQVNQLDQIPDDCFDEAKELIRTYCDPPRTYTYPLAALYPKGIPHKGNDYSLLLTSIPDIVARFPRSSLALALLQELATDGHDVAGARREVEEAYTALRWLYGHFLEVQQQFAAIEKFGTSIRVHRQLS